MFDDYGIVFGIGFFLAVGVLLIYAATRKGDNGD
ncbi:protein of unknown function [Candidatus Methylocalor cossyra]|uniref:Uncharacterized protein n=1 Tax=Candidatus Methylocalor cossyra TaxID=3108543 RepID=A0ABP1C6W6_9GAMM